MDKKSEDRKKVLRGVNLEKSDLNRKLIAWVFVGTGLISLFLWWRGREDRGEKITWFGEKTLSFDLKSNGTEVKPTTKQEEQEIMGREKMLGEAKSLVASSSGTYSLYVYRLDSKVGYGINEREIMPGASLLKVPAMMAALQKIISGEMSLENEYELKDADRSPGSGPLQYLKTGAIVDLDRILSELGKKSDNTAWLMLNRILEIETIEDVILALGMTDTDYREVETTAVDVAKMFSKAYDGEVVGDQGWERMKEYLTESIYEDRIPVGIKDGARIVHKVGTLSDVWTDAGVIEPECGSEDVECRKEFEPFVLVIMNEGIIRSEAETVVPRLAELVWRHEANRED